MNEVGAPPTRKSSEPFGLAGNCARSDPGTVIDPALAGPIQITDAPVWEVPDDKTEEIDTSTNPVEGANGSVKSAFRGMDEGRLFDEGGALRVVVTDQAPTFFPPELDALYEPGVRLGDPGAAEVAIKKYE